MHPPRNERVRIDYSSRRYLFSSRTGWIAATVVVLLLALAISAVVTSRRYSSVNYSQGLIRNRLCVFGVPLSTTERAIFENQRETPEPGSWRLLTSQGVFGTAKEETSDTQILSDLRITLQAVVLLGGRVSEEHKRELVQAAWDAAVAGDGKRLHMIRSDVEREVQSGMQNEP